MQSASRQLLEANADTQSQDSRYSSNNIHHGSPSREQQSAVQNYPIFHGLDGASANINGKQDGLPGFEDLREKILNSLRKSSPPLSPSRSSLHTSKAKKLKYAPLTELLLPEANAALMPHDIFRNLVVDSSINGKPLRRIIRAQLLRAQRPREIYKVLAVCFSSKEGTLSLPALCQSIARALYRCRVNVSDPEVLSTIGVIIARFRTAGLPVSDLLLGLGLRFAARSRSLESMKKYLRLFRETGRPMNVHAFRSVIAKFSIGKRGLGEIRNGRWKSSDLLQVVKGFEDCAHLPPEEQYHLGAFLDRSDWQYLHGWVAVLARCRDTDAVWHEWELWKKSPGRLRPRQLVGCVEAVTTKFRGDYWFLDHMLYAGDMERAWKIFEESDMSFRTVRNGLKFRLLERPELASQRSWEGGMREALVEKYEYEMLKMEKAFGVRWKVDADGSEADEGEHLLVQDQWETLEKLGADDWKPESDLRFPHETSEGDVLLVPDRQEKELHKAEERGLVVFEHRGD